MRVYRRGKRGICWVDITVDGERIKRSAGTTDETAAREWAATLARDLWRQRRLGDAPTVSWDAAVLSWLGEHQHLRSIEEVKRNLRWLSERLQGKALASITSDVVRKLSSERRAQKIRGDLTSPATVNRHLSDLSRILNHAHSRGWLPAPPPIAKLHEAAKRVTWITHDQARTLLAELPEHLASMAKFGLATGLRESNIRLLEWSQVDLSRSLAWVHADQAKAGKDIAVPLNADALAVLRGQTGRHKKWVFPAPLWAKTAKAGKDPHQTWERPTGKISSMAWRKACIRADLPTLRFHDLRHTWASWHVQSGTPLAVLQELGGWASLSMVQRYAHLSVSHVAAWAGNISGTHSVQAATETAKKEGPEGPATEVGWLMGLEPTTTRITRRAHAGQVLQINDLRAAKKPKSA
jgi:integrase